MIYSKKEIREYLGHNGHECRVVIHEDGSISRFGSPQETSRDMDFWQDIGTIESVTREMSKDA